MLKPNKSFIQNINYLAQNLSTLEKSRELLTPAAIRAMESALALPFEEIVEDLKKGVSSAGKRKLDIETSGNGVGYLESVLYDKITVESVNGLHKLTHSFAPTSRADELLTGLKEAIREFNESVPENAAVMDAEIELILQRSIPFWLIRVTDLGAEHTRLSRVILHVSEGSSEFAKKPDLEFTWSKSTSSILLLGASQDFIAAGVNRSEDAQNAAEAAELNAKTSEESAEISATNAENSATASELSNTESAASAEEARVSAATAKSEVAEAFISGVADATEQADRAEVAADIASTAGLIFSTSSGGQASAELSSGEYFWVESSQSGGVLELWQKGASSASYTGKQTVSSEAILTPQEYQFEQGGYSSENGSKLVSNLHIRPIDKTPARLVSVTLDSHQECRVFIFGHDGEYLSATEFSDTHRFVGVDDNLFTISLRNKDSSPITPSESTAKFSIDGFSASTASCTASLSASTREEKIKEILRLTSTQKNLMPPADFECRALSAEFEVAGRNASLVEYQGAKAIKVIGEFNNISGQHDIRLHWTFSAALFPSRTATAMVLGLKHGGDMDFSLTIREKDNDGRNLSTSSTVVYSGISNDESVGILTTPLNEATELVELRLFIRGSENGTPNFESIFCAPSIFDGVLDEFRGSHPVGEVDTYWIQKNGVSAFNCDFVTKPESIFSTASWAPGLTLYDTLDGQPVEADPSRHVSSFVRVQPESLLSFGPSGAIAQYDSDFNWVGFVTTASPVKMSARTAYVRASTSQLDGFSAVEGDIHFSADNGREELALPLKDSLAPYTRRAGNLLDASKLLPGFNFNDDGDLIEDPARFSNPQMLPIEGNREILAADIPNSRIAFYGSDRSYIDQFSLISGTALVTPENAAYYRIRSQLVGAYTRGAPSAVIYYTDEGRGAAFPNQYGRIPSGHLLGTRLINKPYAFSPIMRDGVYRATDSLPFDDVVALGYSTKVADLYEAYDLLISENPEYIQKDLLGRDESDSFDIWKLTFKPQYPPSITSLLPVPKIVITSGIHGHEWISIWSTYLLAKDLCDNWKENPLLEWLRWNVEIVIVPSLNPWGLDQDTSVGGIAKRKNSNGIDINRSFPIDFVVGSDPSAIDYGGQEPLTEAESQIADQLMSDNTDATLFIDSHNYGGSDPNDRLWLGFEKRTFTPIQSMAAKQIIQDVTINLAKNYYEDTAGTWYSGMLSNIANGTRLRGHASLNHGVNAILLESGNTSSILSMRDLVKLNTENLGAVIINWIKTSMMYGD